MQPCRTRGAAFELSLAAGVKGAPDPVGAARIFVRRGGLMGFGTRSSTWVVAGSSHLGRGDVTVVEGRVSLHAIRLPDGTWAIDEGYRCT